MVVSLTQSLQRRKHDGAGDMYLQTRQLEVRKQLYDSVDLIAVENQIHDVWCWQARLQRHQERYDSLVEVGCMLVASACGVDNFVPRATEQHPDSSLACDTGLRASQLQMCRGLWQVRALASV